MLEFALRILHSTVTHQIPSFTTTFHSNIQADPILGYRLRNGFRRKAFQIPKPKTTFRIIADHDQLRITIQEGRFFNAVCNKPQIGRRSFAKVLK